MPTKAYEFTDRKGSFRMEHPERSSYLYFPIAGDSGLKSCVTPLLGGDSKVDQNTFLLQPVSVEELHNLKSSRNFWCVTEEGAWSAAGASAEAEALQGTALEEYTCLEAGLMWHRMERQSVKYPLSSSITSFVPNDEETFEIMQVTVRNTGDAPVTFTPVAAIPLYCRSADNVRDHRHVTSLLHRIHVMDGGVEVTPTLTFDERGHKKNTKTYYVYGTEEDGTPVQRCCPTVEDFIGEGGSLARPRSLFEAAASGIWAAPGTDVDGCEAMGALRFCDATLQPGEARTWCIYMGLTDRENAQHCRDHILCTYGGKENTQKALDQVKAEWPDKVNVHCESKDPDWDNYMYWVSFQPILRRMYGCSFLPYHDYGKGGRGWRDLWQDCLALLIMEPDGVREKLLDYYGGVRMDGTNATIIGQKQGEFIADRNSITRVWMDHGFWPFQTTELYIQQTGDLDILTETATYFKDKQIFRGEKKDELWNDSQGVRQLDAAGNVVSGTILEHILVQNITAFYDVGAHNHIRLRGADWNDGFDMAVQNGESVAFTAAYAGNLDLIASLLRKMAAETPARREMEFHKEVCILLQDRSEIYDSIKKKQALLQQYSAACEHTISGETETVALEPLAGVLEKMAQWIREHIRKTEWLETPEGSFYNGYYDDHCRQMEGSFPNGTRMALTSQVFPIMFGTALDSQAEQIIRSADALLYQPGIGGYRLNTNFHEIKDDMGRAFGFAYGHKENGAVFSHMTVMYANALYRRGFIKAGFRALDALYRQAANFDRSRIYPGLPEYFSGTGRGMYPYLTGSASWLMMTVVTQVYGVQGSFGDLLIEPKLLGEQLDDAGRIGLRMTFAGVPLHIRYEAKAQQETYTGVKALYLDGEKLPGNRIPRDLLTCRRADGTERDILVVL